MSIEAPPIRESGDRCPRDGAATMFISVVVPVRNEANFIEQTLTQLITQDYDPQRFELLVVDGESTDGTPDLIKKFVERYTNVRLFSNPRRLSSAARNIAIGEARGDVVLLVDGHCELDSTHYLSNLAEAFERSGADCIGRPQPQDIAGASTLQRAIAAARSSRLGHHPDSFIYSLSEGFVPAKSVAAAYRRSVFDKIGPFDETFDACEDVELNHRIDRAGLRCFFTPLVAAHYAPRDTLRGLFRQLVRYGRGRVRLLRKHPETFSCGILPPLAFVVGLIVGLPLSLLSAWFAITYAAGLCVYTLLVVAGSVAVAIREGNGRLLAWLPLVFFTIHCAAGAGMLLELSSPRTRKCRSSEDACVA